MIRRQKSADPLAVVAILSFLVHDVPKSHPVDSVVPVIVAGLVVIVHAPHGVDGVIERGKRGRSLDGQLRGHRHRVIDGYIESRHAVRLVRDAQLGPLLRSDKVFPQHSGNNVPSGVKGRSCAVRGEHCGVCVPIFRVNVWVILPVSHPSIRVGHRSHLKNIYL